MSFVYLTTGYKYEIRPIPQCDGYFADNMGKIWSTRKRKRLTLYSQHLGQNNRYYVTLRRTRNSEKLETLRVHVLVLWAFSGPRPDQMVARHLNGNPHDNRPCNLKWGTRSENAADMVKHGRHPWSSKNRSGRGHSEGWWRSSTTNATVIDIAKAYINGAKTEDLAERHGVSTSLVSDVMRGRRWTRVTGIKPYLGGADRTRRMINNPEEFSRFIGFNPIRCGVEARGDFTPD